MYFIFDASDTLVGNPLGYKTVAIANRVANSPRTGAHKALWATFNARRSANPGHTRFSRIAGEKLKQTF